ncbi:response regulator transcription factor [Neolewinella aurantiaca]|uniref:Response regulator transcription factor n=1 Tax=Neolewinella aurantiaca TaxID=2602767 RepID=A0A5C7FRS6_9BACT|nr:LytTR family transcriptional regulator DNA-binding domain-containing protein [Neolewinella aurantiaca]TXF89059.1 response regulator transcription factor [Neolewinella aurantiaca]
MSQLNSPLQILVVEDEFVTLDTLCDALNDMGYEVAGDAMTIEEAKEVLARQEVDLAILDINVRGKNKGIELGHYINKHFGIPFVYLTAYSDPATIASATDSAPYGYLIKPFSPAEIHASIKVAINRYQASAKTKENYIYLKDQGTFFRLRVEDIHYVEAFRNYVEVNTNEGKRVIRGTLKEITEKLPSRTFFQPHRSFLVNAEWVSSYKGGFLTVRGASVPVSRSGHKVVMQVFSRR